MSLSCPSKKRKLSRSEPPAAVSDRDEVRADELLSAHGVRWRRWAQETGAAPREVLATLLMDLYRQTKSSEVFEALVRLTRAALLQRVRVRTRYQGDRIDGGELLQEALINIYRYPDRFDASRPGAFRAWSSTIVDNAVRRHLRRPLSSLDVNLWPIEILAQEPDRRATEPGFQAMQAEATERCATAFRVFLCSYLHAYQQLSSRERFVLQMVEVRGLRYAQLAEVLEMRPEALKMVVFRARRRIFERMSADLRAAA